jgi:hypothetical protein
MRVCVLVRPLHQLCNVQLQPTNVTCAELSRNSDVLLQPSGAHKLPLCHTVRCSARADRLYCRLNYRHSTNPLRRFLKRRTDRQLAAAADNRAPSNNLRSHLSAFISLPPSPGRCCRDHVTSMSATSRRPGRGASNELLLCATHSQQGRSRNA